MKNDCYFCNEHTATCHIDCERYRKLVENNREAAKKKRIEDQLNDISAQRTAKREHILGRDRKRRK